MRLPAPAALLALLATAPASFAGVYYSGERFAELPSQWRGFLLDHRALRALGVPPAGKGAARGDRARYESEVERLRKTASRRALSADEAADLGALLVRLGDPAAALQVLGPAFRASPEQFRLAANLGTAWQLQGDLTQAAAALEQAVRLAPGKLQAAEELHLRLVRSRSREARGSEGLDDLFGVRYSGPGGAYAPGSLPAGQREKLPAEAAALLQRLALSLPADGRLLWQLGELASAQGDVATAAAVMDGCVKEFGLRAPELLAHRRAQRAVADALAGGGGKPVTKPEHRASHAGGLKARSSRPIVPAAESTPRPPIDHDGLNAVPWNVFTETTVDRHYHPTFGKYLKELEGKRVRLTGSMQPAGDDVEGMAFLLIEYPVGCWFCETPPLTGIVRVELAEGRTQRFSRNTIRVEGRLRLNAVDPERFLYTLSEAKAVED